MIEKFSLDANGQSASAFARKANLVESTLH